MVCLLISRIFPTPWGGHTTNSPALKGASFRLVLPPLRISACFAVFALVADGFFLTATFFVLGRLLEEDLVLTLALTFTLVLAFTLVLTLVFVLVFDLTLTLALAFELAGLLALAFTPIFAFVRDFARAVFFVADRRADALDLLVLVLLEAVRFDPLAAFFAAGLLLFETRFLFVVFFFFFDVVVPLMF